MPRAAHALIKIVLAFGVAGGLAACSGGDTGGQGAASCVAALEFEGRIYVAAQVAPVPVAGEAGQAVTPPCNDTGQNDEPSSEPFPVLKIAGIDPSVAVATEAETAGSYWVWVTGEEPYSMTVPPALQKILDAAS